VFFTLMDTAVHTRCECPCILPQRTSTRPRRILLRVSLYSAPSATICALVHVLVQLLHRLQRLSFCRRGLHGFLPAVHCDAVALCCEPCEHMAVSHAMRADGVAWAEPRRGPCQNAGALQRLRSLSPCRRLYCLLSQKLGDSRWQTQRCLDVQYATSKVDRMKKALEVLGVVSHANTNVRTLVFAVVAIP
jgi:hypothetical protein